MVTPSSHLFEFLANPENQKAIAELEKLLAPMDSHAMPLPASVPRKSGDTEARLHLAEARAGSRLAAIRGEAPRLDAAALEGNIEHFLGFAQVPLGLIGPLRIRGTKAQGDYYVPLATTEGALVASYGRGARLLSLAGGVSCASLPAWVQRAPGFAFRTLAEAGRFAAWVSTQFEVFQAEASTRSRHAELARVAPHMEGNQVHLVLSYSTGDAAGQNMVTLCSEAVCQRILATTPVKPRYWFLEANFSGDKKATVQSLLTNRGHKVVAEARISKALVERGLHTTVKRMCDYWRMSFTGGAQTGSIGVSGHVANGLAAIFLATGQDVACVSEAAIGITRLEQEEDGGLYISVTLPNLIVGSLGGGTRMPTATECLKLMGCLGESGADALAEICAAVSMAGELSIIGALCAGDFASAHAKLGRKKA